MSQILSSGPPKPHKPNHMGGRILKIPLVSRAWSSGRGHGRGLTSNLLKSFFFKIPDLVHRPTASAVVGGNCR